MWLIVRHGMVLLGILLLMVGFQLTSAFKDTEFIRKYALVRMSQVDQMAATSANDPAGPPSLVIVVEDGPDQEIRLDLRRRLGVITSNTNISVISRVSGRRHLDLVRDLKLTDHYYEGNVNEDQASFVHGIIENTLFTGYFFYDNEIYLLDPYARYFSTPTSPGSSPPYNAILYKASDVYTCKNKAADELAGPAVEEDDYFLGERRNLRDDCNTSHPDPNHLKRIDVTPISVIQLGLHALTTISTTMKLRRRQIGEVEKQKSAYICDLRIVTDFRFTDHVAGGSENYAAQIVVAVMKNVDMYFRKNDMDRDGREENIGFFITALDIYMDPIAEEFHDFKTWEPVKFFREFQKYDFRGGCAGLLFTFRQMEDHAPHAASLFKANIQRMDQGICGSFHPPKVTGPADDYGQFVANALPVNFNRRGQLAPVNHMISQITHQLGHLFGRYPYPSVFGPLSVSFGIRASVPRFVWSAHCFCSHNDEWFNRSDCATSNIDEQYAMAFPVPPGNTIHNFMLSPCSAATVARFLKEIERPCLRSCTSADCYSPIVTPTIPMMTHKRRDMTARGWTETCFTILRPADSSTTSRASTLLEVAILGLMFFVMHALA